MRPGRKSSFTTWRSSSARSFFRPAGSLALVGLGSIQSCLAPVLSGSRRSTHSDRQKLRPVAQRLRLEALEEYTYPGDPIGLLAGAVGGAGVVLAAQSLGLLSSPAHPDHGDFALADFLRHDRGAGHRSAGLSGLDDGSGLPDQRAVDILSDTWSGDESLGGTRGEASGNEIGQARRPRSPAPTLLIGGGAGNWGGGNGGTAGSTRSASGGGKAAGQPAPAAPGSGGVAGLAFAAAGSPQTSAGGAAASGLPIAPTAAASQGGLAATAQAVSPSTVNSAAGSATPSAPVSASATASAASSPSAATPTGNVTDGSTAPVSAPALQSAVGQLPLTFEVNQGQTSSQVQFFARGSGYNLFLSSDAATFALSEPQGTAGTTASASSPAAGTQPGTDDSTLGDTTTAMLQMQFVGANPAAQAVGVDQQPGTVNYLIGNDPSQWHTDIATYGKVDYNNLYPGIDLVYYGNPGQLEYDWQVAPGANPGLIQVAFQGADQLTLDPQGDLIIQEGGATVTEQAPVLYQEIGGVQQAVDGHFVLKADNQVALAVGSYDHSQPLVIDPVLSYSTYLGGSASDMAKGIANSGGDVYVTGIATSANFPTQNEFQGTRTGSIDTFVSEFDANGKLVYSTYLGGSGVQEGAAIAVDSAGSAYVTGFTTSANFPTTPGAYKTTLAGGYDAFVTKLTPAGNALAYSTFLGGSGTDQGLGIAVDAGNATTVGTTSSTNFPTRSRSNPP